MSASSAFFDLAERDSLAQRRQDMEDLKRNRQFINSTWHQRGVPENHVDNIDAGVATFNGLTRNFGYKLGKKKPIAAVNG